MQVFLLLFQVSADADVFPLHGVYLFSFIDFSTFKEKFGPNMSKLVEVPERELHLPNLAPNAAKLNEYGTRARSFKTSFDQVRKGFAPEVDASKYFSYRDLTCLV